MIATINKLSQQYEQKQGHRANLLYINNEQLELLKEQFCEKKVDAISQMIGMEIILVQDLKQAYVSWAQISWKHNSIA